jgi:retron-type reverse transcriptase
MLIVIVIQIHVVLLTLVILPQSFYKHICDIPNNKSSGIDGFSVKLLKLAAPYVCHSIAYICNLSLRTSVYPTDWKLAKVTPIFKAGDKLDVGNYRPISVLPLISKIIERAVHNQLYSYLTSMNILLDNQSGFRSNHSTETTLNDVQDFILKNMDNGQATGAIFLDLKKAFDCVNHALLIEKLSNYGIKGITLEWFKSYLGNRAQAVNINATLSDFKNIDIGIPQGSILGPLLFIIFVNSLSNSVDCKCTMYADDTTLLCTANDSSTLQSKLQCNLSKIADWFKKNNLTLNIKKTKFMVFGTRRVLENFKDVSLYYNNDSIERVDVFKYLGVTFDPIMDWSDHINGMSSCISKRCGVIRRVKPYIPKDTLIMLANAIVMPNFDYCNTVWSNCSAELSNSLQILHNRLARIILSADIRTPIDDMMSTLHWNKLNDRWFNYMATLTFKCLKGMAPGYLSSQFTFMHDTHSKGTRSQTNFALFEPPWNINAGKRTFHSRAAKLWNSLPTDDRRNFNSMSIAQHKQLFLIKPV